MVVARPRGRRAGGAAALVVVVGGQVAWSSVRGGSGAQAALLHVSLSSGGKSCGRRSAVGAACTRRCCSCRCRFGPSGVVVGRPRVRRARGGAASVVVGWAQVVRSAVGWRRVCCGPERACTVLKGGLSLLPCSAMAYPDTSSSRTSASSGPPSNGGRRTIAPRDPPCATLFTETSTRRAVGSMTA